VFVISDTIICTHSHVQLKLGHVAYICKVSKYLLLYPHISGLAGFVLYDASPFIVLY